MIELPFYSVGRLRFIQPFNKRHRGNVLIVMYHRVLPDVESYINCGFNSDLTIPLKTFENHIKFFSTIFNPTPIDKISLTKPTGDKARIILTFDDGYNDFLSCVLPVLKKYNFPAILYITTRFLQGECDMWWYELDELCRARSKIEMSYMDNSYVWELGTTRKKSRCFSQISKLFLSLTNVEIKKIMQEIRSDKVPKDYSQYCLTWDNVLKLDRDPLVSIGAHTHTHPNLSVLSEEAARTEILRGKQILEDRLGHPIKHFAYPYGTKNQVGDREIRLTQECGFTTAVTTRCDVINENPNLFSLPRYEILRRYSMSQLSVKLSGWNAFWKRQF